MIAVSANCVAIAQAIKCDAVRLVERPSRFGGTFISIEDATGVIEVADTMSDAENRIKTIRDRLK